MSKLFEYKITGIIFSVCFSNNGKFMLCSSSDKRIWVWRFPSGEFYKTLNNFSSSVLAICTSVDDRYIAGVDFDGNVSLWDLRNKFLFKNFSYSQKGSITISISSDSKLLAIGDMFYPYKVRLFSIESGDLLTMIGEHESGISNISFFSNNRYLVSSSLDSYFEIWDITRGELVHDFFGHQGGVNTFDLSSNDSFIISGGSDDFIKFWDVSRHPRIVKRISVGESISSIKISPSNDYFLLALNTSIELYSISNGQIIYRKESCHNGNINSINFSPDGQYYLSGGDDQIIKVWYF